MKLNLIKSNYIKLTALHTIVFVLLTINSYAQTLAWAKHLSGDFVIQSYGIATDANGNVYSTGYFNGTVDFDPGPNVVNISAGNDDIFISKIDASGNFIWAKKIGGITDDFGRSITTDINGDVYITGYFFGTVDFDPGAGTFNLSTSSNDDIFILKLSAAGNFLWAKQIGGFTADEGYSIKTDASGNIYTTGYFKGTVDFDPGAGIENLSAPGHNDIFVSKLDSSGNFLWARQFGGSNDDLGYSLDLDASGNIYTTGIFRGTADFDPGAATFNFTSAGDKDIFITKLNSSGNLVWAKQIGGVASDEAVSLSTDASGNIYTTGNFTGTVDFDPGSGTYIIPTAGQNDVFILKLDNSGNFVWAKNIGNGSFNYGHAITTDALGNVYTTGSFAFTVDFDPGVDTFNLVSFAGGDIFISKLDPSGNFVSAYQMGGASYDAGRAITTDVSGNIYTTGTFQYTVDFDPGAGVFNIISDQGYDVFLHKMSLCVTNVSTINQTACNSYVSPSGNNIWTTSGTYIDTMANTAGCDSIITVNLTIISVNSSVTNSSPTLTANATGATYQWLDCNNSFAVIAGETNQSYLAPINGSYAVLVTQNNCSDTSACEPVTNASMFENDFGSNFVISPNPFSESISIGIGKQYNEVTITIINALGQIVMPKQTFTNKQIELAFESEAGTYFITIQAEDKTFVHKLIKQ